MTAQTTSATVPAGRALIPPTGIWESRRHAWHHFVETTTAHGFSKFGYGSAKRKIFWLVILVLANAGFITHLSFLVKRFFEIPVTSSRNEAPEHFQFPDVTFCPSSPVSDVKMRSAFAPDLGNRSLRQVASLLEPVWRLVTGNATDYLDYPLLTLRRRLIGLGAIYQPPEMVMLCQFYGYSCDLRNFTAYVDPNLLGCATFHSPANLQRESPNTVVSGLGIVGISRNEDSGLAARYQSRKMALFQGMIVTAHEPGTRPRFVGNTFNSYNTEYFVMRLFTGSYEAVSTLSNPCERVRENITVVTPGTGAVATYLETEEDCESNCLQDLIQADCNCTSERLHVTVAQAALGLPGCHQDAERFIDAAPNANELAKLRSRWRCHQRWMRASRNSALPCTCKLYCARALIASSVSNYDFDDDISRQSTLLTFNQTIVPAYLAARLAANFTSVFNVADVRYALEGVGALPLTRTVTQFEILPEVSKTMKAMESETYGVDALCSDFGSIMGLWLGMSVLTVCEFLEMGIRLVAAF